MLQHIIFTVKKQAVDNCMYSDKHEYNMALLKIDTKIGFYGKTPSIGV